VLLIAKSSAASSTRTVHKMPVCRWSLGVPGPDAPDRISALQADFRFGGKFIADTARRGITLRQIEKIVDWAMKSSKDWYDATPTKYSKTGGCRITVDNLNLYTVNTWLIMPATRTPLQIGSEVNLPDGKTGTCVEWAPSGGFWSTQLDDGSVPNAEPAERNEGGGAAETKGREEEFVDDTWRETWLTPGATVSFSNDRKGKLQEFTPPSGHWIVEVDGGTVTMEPKELTASTDPWECAFVEVLALEDQPPVWFVSHWWGEPIVHFAGCVRLHAEVRLGSVKSRTPLEDQGGRMRHGYKMEADQDSPYWVCAYANRQWSLSQEVVEDPKKTSFYRALVVAKGLGGGTLLILDAKNEVTQTGPGTPFSRVWCAFEESTSINDLELPLDIAAYHNAKAELLTSDTTAQDKQSYESETQKFKVSREMTFPIEVLKKGMDLKLEQAEATQDRDRVHILNAIAAGQKELSVAELNAEPPVKHENFEMVNKRLGSTFAIAGWRQGLESGILDMRQLATTLKMDRWRVTLVLEFGWCDQFDDDALMTLAGIFPTSLKILTLGMGLCMNITDDGLQSLGAGLAQLKNLATLSLNFKVCKITDDGLQKLGDGLAQLKNLATLSLEFGMCKKIGDDGLQKLAAGVAQLKNLVTLSLNFLSCDNIGDDGLQKLGDGLAQLKNLATVSLNFAWCKKIGDDGLQKLGDGLAQLKNLATLSLNFKECNKIGDDGLQKLATGLEQLKNLRTLSLMFGFTNVSDEMKQALDGYRQVNCVSSAGIAKALKRIRTKDAAATVSDDEEVESQKQVGEEERQASNDGEGGK